MPSDTPSAGVDTSSSSSPPAPVDTSSPGPKDVPNANLGELGSQWKPDLASTPTAEVPSDFQASGTTQTREQLEGVDPELVDKLNKIFGLTPAEQPAPSVETATPDQGVDLTPG